MELRELNAEEEVVLVGLLRDVAQADGRYSESEKRHVDRVRVALGEARFDKAVITAREHYGTRELLKEAAKAVTRKDARIVMYDTLDAMAAADGKTADEARPLAWLASWWELAKPAQPR